MYTACFLLPCIRRELPVAGPVGMEIWFVGFKAYSCDAVPGHRWEATENISSQISFSSSYAGNFPKNFQIES